MELSPFGFPDHTAGGTCYLCLGSPQGPVVVTNRYDEWDAGTVVICGDCAKYAGKLMGLVEGKKLLAENVKLREQVAELQPQVVAFQEVRKALEGLSLVG